MLTQDRLKQILHYDPETGFFTRLVQRGRHKAGSKVGFMNDGYMKIGFDGREYYSGRLAWFYVHGLWPHPEVDHIDRNPLNDRLQNLREATRRQNCANEIKPAVRQGKYRGITPRGKKWIAQAVVNGKQQYLGMYMTQEAAAKAYNRATAKEFGEFAVLNEALL